MASRSLRLLPVLSLAAINAFTPAQAALRPDQVAFHDLYKELVETNTTSSVGSCTQAAEQVAARLRKAGFTDDQLTLYVPPGRPLDGGLVATWAGRDKNEPAVLLLAHIDVVEARREDWVRDPFKLVEEDGYFYARGASDDKAQAAIFSDTLIRLKQTGFAPRRTIKLALTCGEESTSPKVLNGAGWLAANRPELLKAGFALNEGGGGRAAPGGGPETLGVEVAQKSPRNFVLEVTNPGGHSSVPKPDNAIYRLSAAMAKLSGLTFPVHFNPVTKDYFTKVGGMRKDATGEAMIQLAAHPDDEEAQAVIAAAPEVNAFVRTTCVATLFEAGHAANALPQRATATVNCRIVPGETADETKAAIARVIDDPAVKILRSEIAERPVAVPPPLDPKMLGPMQAIGAKHFPGIPFLLVEATGATDATYLARVGVPTYGVPGLWNDPATSGTHGLNERISADALYRGRDYLYDLIVFYASH